MSPTEPAAEDFLAAGPGLSHRERLRLSRLRHPGRRLEFADARRLAKRLLRRVGVVNDCVRDEAISILPTVGPSERPRLWVGHVERPTDVSLAHSSGWVAAAVRVDGRVGVDLVVPSEVRPHRLAAWFSPAEHRLALEESLTLADLWAMKEAAFKATSELAPFRPGDYPVEADRGWTAGGCPVRLEVAEGLTIAVAAPNRDALRDASRVCVERMRIPATPETPETTGPAATAD